MAKATSCFMCINGFITGPLAQGTSCFVCINGLTGSMLQGPGFLPPEEQI